MGPWNIKLLLIFFAMAAPFGTARAKTFISSAECREYYNALKVREPVVRTRIKSVHAAEEWSPEYTEWRNILTELTSVLGTCSAMERSELEESAEKKDKDDSAKADVEQVNKVHDGLSKAVLSSTKNSTVRNIQKKALSAVRDTQLKNASDLDEALWEFNNSDFGASGKVKAPASLWDIKGAPSLKPAVGAVGSSSAAAFTKRIDEFNAPRKAAEEAERQRAAEVARLQAQEEERQFARLKAQFELMRIRDEIQKAIQTSAPQSSTERLQEECYNDGGHGMIVEGPNGRDTWYCTLMTPKWQSRGSMPM